MDFSRNLKSHPPGPESIDLNKLMAILRTNWIWIVFILLAVNAAGYLYIRYTKNLYESESELKLDVKSDATDLGITTLVEEKNMNLLSGEIEIITSKLFLSRVLDESRFEVSFFSVGRVLNEELYRSAPARVVSFNKDHGLYNIPIKFEEVNRSEFLLTPGEEGKEVRGRYGEKIHVGDLELVLERNDDFLTGSEIGYFLILNSRDVLLNYLSSNLTAEPLNFNANTIRLSFQDHNPFKAQAVLNKIDSVYLEYSNEQKNLANKQKIDWLTQELNNIEKRMEDFEDYFENFTLQNRTNNLDEDLKRTIASINTLDSQRYDYTRRISELNTLIDGLVAGEFMFSLTLRQALPGHVNDQLDALQELEMEQEKLKLSYNEITFAYRQKQKEIETVRLKTVEQLRELKSLWLRRLQDLNKKKATLETQFAGLPDKNTQFSKNQRFYKLYEEFYLTLMQSKSEFEIAQAGSTADFRILSPATLPSTPIAPNKLMIAGVGMVASLVVVFFFVGILYLLNNKITNLDDLERIGQAPVLGLVPMSNRDGSGLHVVDHPKSMVSEAIRTLRTNLDFFSLSGDKKVVAISSTVSGEGKSFIAMNLGGILALSRKKVVLIDLDMRKAKTDLPVNFTDPTKGVSTILIRKNTWQESIVRTQIENFHYLPSGPHPPNPSELLLDGEFSDLLADLKKHYDFILMDTPPAGLVTDGIMAMKHADVSLYVFRANYSKKEFLMNLRRIITINKFSNITTILNAVPASGKTYGYGYYDDEGIRKSKKKSLFGK